MDNDVRHLLDRAAITDTVLRFFYALDRFDWNEIERVVADTMTLSAEAADVAPVPLTRAQFIEGTRARNGGFVATLHGNAGHLITIDGDQAHVVAQMFASHIAGPAADEVLSGYGFNELDLERTDDGWRINSLTIRAIAGQGDPAKVYGLAAQRQKDGQGH